MGIAPTLGYHLLWLLLCQILLKNTCWATDVIFDENPFFFSFNTTINILYRYILDFNEYRYRYVIVQYMANYCDLRAEEYILAFLTFNRFLEKDEK